MEVRQEDALRISSADVGGVLDRPPQRKPCPVASFEVSASVSMGIDACPLSICD